MTSINSGPIFIQATHAHPNITNVCAIWRSGPAISGNVKGITGPSITLATTNGFYLNYGVLRGYDAKMGLSCSYTSPGKKLMSEHLLPLPEGDYVYLEIDVNPRTGRVVFWANDKGLDVGVLDGFKGGAQQAAWRSLASPNAPLMSGRFTDCAIGTEKGWMPAQMHEDNLIRKNLQANHQATLVAHNTLVFGDQRSLNTAFGDISSLA